MEFKFSTAFESDLTEAFDYWKSSQIAKTDEEKAKIDKITLDIWVISILATPVYQLLKEKRTSLGSSA